MNRAERERGTLEMLRAGYTIAEAAHAYSMARETVESLLGFSQRPTQVLRPVEVAASLGWFPAGRRRNITPVISDEASVISERQAQLREALA